MREVNELRQIKSEQFVPLIHRAYNVHVLARAFGKHLKHSGRSIHDVSRSHKDSIREIWCIRFRQQIDGARRDVKSRDA